MIGPKIGNAVAPSNTCTVTVQGDADVLLMERNLTFRFVLAGGELTTVVVAAVVMAVFWKNGPTTSAPGT
jgi:hypothetical protein